MNLAFIPLYIEYLGVEAYALIGVLAVIQQVLGLIENGLNPALGREMARFKGGQHTIESIWSLLRSTEILITLMALLAAALVWLTAGWVTRNWLEPVVLTPLVVTRAIQIMGFIVAIRFLENLYSSVLLGLQSQVSQNAILSVMATIRAVGAIGVLELLSPSIDAFFVWQLVASMLSLCWLRWDVYGKTPRPEKPPIFSPDALRSISSFASGMIFLTILAVAMTQLDKLLLPKLLTLTEYGYYIVAYMAASAILMLRGPVASAYYPQMIQLFSRSDSEGLSKAYHTGAQLTAVLVGSSAAFLSAFSERVLYLWTGDLVVSATAAPILSLLSIGVLFVGLQSFPDHLQLASGWTRLRIRTDLAALVVFLPCFVLLVPNNGSIAAAFLWTALQFARLVINVPIMHRRLLIGEERAWAIHDVLHPILAVFGVALLISVLIPARGSRLGEMAALISSLSLVFLAGTVSARETRKEAWTIVRKTVNWLTQSCRAM